MVVIDNQARRMQIASRVTIGSRATSYKWAEILACDAYGAFDEATKQSSHALALVGRKFRDTILARGGAQHPEDIFEASFAERLRW
ncbi:hypothetical protein PsorP6_007118 [Peronosclerospora sorghi]|uniref:Uncharacterized protein n=1 Tax=Peronosclerospora sorghi TaxID=230839 RepID=A0ACC0W8E8_9STRA|nr:hypothetical protein PsorP6_007118 [Peronosclerospora sorghi]